MRPKIDFDKLQAGDRDEWKTCFERLNGISKRVLSCRYPILSEEDKEDISVDSILKLLKRLDTIKSTKHLEGSIVKITRYTASEFYRKLMAQKRGGGKICSLQSYEKSHEEKLGQGSNLDLDPDSESVQSSTEPSCKEDDTTLREALDQLNERDKAIIEDYYDDEMTGADMQKKYNITEQNLHVILHRIRKKLKTIIEDLRRKDANE